LVVERNSTSGPLANSPQAVERPTAELHLFGRWLSGSPIIRIGLDLLLDCTGFYEINLPLNYRLSDQVQYSVMPSRISNQAWSKGSDAGTCCK